MPWPPHASCQIWKASGRAERRRPALPSSSIWPARGDVSCLRRVTTTRRKCYRIAAPARRHHFSVYVGRSSGRKKLRSSERQQLPLWLSRAWALDASLSITAFARVSVARDPAECARERGGKKDGGVCRLFKSSASAGSSATPKRGAPRATGVICDLAQAALPGTGSHCWVSSRYAINVIDVTRNWHMTR